MHSSLQFPGLLKYLYVWWDRRGVTGSSSSIILYAKEKNEEDMANSLSSFYREVFEKDNRDAKADAALKKQVKLYREKLHRPEVATGEKIDMRQQPW